MVKSKVEDVLEAYGSEINVDVLGEYLDNLLKTTKRISVHRRSSIRMVN